MFEWLPFTYNVMSSTGRVTISRLYTIFVLTFWVLFLKYYILYCDKYYILYWIMFSRESIMEILVGRQECMLCRDTYDRVDNVYRYKETIILSWPQHTLLFFTFLNPVIEPSQ